MKPIALLVAATAVVATATAAPAQDFLGAIARGAAQSAAQSLANRAVGAITAPRQAPAQTTAQARQAAGAAPTATAAAVAPAASAALPADFPLPHPINYSSALRTPTQMQFSQADKDAAQAFKQIGRYSCNDCEGGYSFDSWVRHEVPRTSGQYQLEDRLGAMNVGEALRWTGSHSGIRYAITVVSDRALPQWPCKQLKWTADLNDFHHEHMGMICKPTDNWHEVL